ncbi:hypothetical protein SALBM311S_11181 [Streptomyces alboniger]
MLKESVIPGAFPVGLGRQPGAFPGQFDGQAVLLPTGLLGQPGPLLEQPSGVPG